MRIDRCFGWAFLVVSFHALSAVGQWHDLFDGRSLSGWEPVIDNGAFQVEDGVLVAGGREMNHLFYVGEVHGGDFKNFEFQAEVMTTAGSNSGVFFHTVPEKGFLLKGYEAQINASHKDKRKTGSLLDVKHIEKVLVKDNEWFDYHLIVEGRRIQVKVNEQTTVDYLQPLHPVRSARRKLRVLDHGYLALQAHDPKSRVLFRNLRIKPLPDFLGDVTLLVGAGPNSPRAESPLTSPFGIDFSRDGSMVIVELEGGRVHRFSKTGELTKISGDGSKSYSGDGAAASHATFNGMHNVAIAPNDDVFIADSWNHCIRKIDAKTGVISTIAGTGEAGYSGDGGPAIEAKFNFVMCISLNAGGDQLYVADLKNRRVRVVELESGLVKLVAGNGQAGVPQDGDLATESPLVDPRAVAADSQGRVYVLERGGHALRRVNQDGSIETVAGTGKKGYLDGSALEAQFNSPKHLCVDALGNVYIADDQNRAIRRFSPDASQVSTVLGRGIGSLVADFQGPLPEADRAPIELSRPHGVCIENGRLYVVDTGNNRILLVE